MNQNPLSSLSLSSLYLHHEYIFVFVEGESANDITDIPFSDWTEIIVAQIEFRNGERSDEGGRFTAK